MGYLSSLCWGPLPALTLSQPVPAARPFQHLGQGRRLRAGGAGSPRCDSLGTQPRAGAAPHLWCNCTAAVSAVRLLLFAHLGLRGTSGTLTAHSHSLMGCQAPILHSWKLSLITFFVLLKVSQSSQFLTLYFVIANGE